MIFAPSPQQQAFFDRVSDPRGGSILLEAVAGAGKTTTLVQGLGLMNGSIFFGAYNKAIAQEIRAKVDDAGLARPDLFISTMHGAGYSAFRRAFPKVRLDENKVEKLIVQRAMLAGHEANTIIAATGFLVKTVSIAKQFLVGVKANVHSAKAWKCLVARFSLDFDLPENVEVDDLLPHLIALHTESHRISPEVVDFDDMIFAPIAHDVRCFRNDWVLIDERQDTNVARRELARRMLKPSGRLVAVGDTHQAIYGFTGATGGADRFITEFGCHPMPLTVTYRCPKAVVAHARRWVSHIEAHPSALEGEVREPVAPTDDKDVRAWFQRDVPAATDAVLCRYTRPLVSTAYEMIRAGHACRVEGRNIGNGLKKLATRWKSRTIDALEKKLDGYLKKQVARAGDNEAKAQAVTDVVETLRIFLDRARDAGGTRVDDVVREIDALFADDVSGVTTLATIHKSKGREWDRVYWLQATLRGKRSLQPWEAEQEDNLNYVATTRAKRSLVLVPEGI